MSLSVSRIIGHDQICLCPCCAAPTLAEEAAANVTAMAAAGSKPVFTQAQVIDQLTTNWSASGYSAAWDKPVVSYSLSYLPAASGGSEAVGWQAMTAVMKNTAREVFELWDDVIAIDITESANDAGSDISFNYSSTTGGSTYARWSGSFGGTRADMAMTNSDIWFADNWWTHDDDSDFYGGGYGITTYIHEIGHALGLSHPGSYNGSASFASDAEYHQDTRQYTTMSYFNAGQNGETVDHTAANGYSTRYAATPLLHDILALQSLYGADTTTRTGNTVYGFNSNAGRSAFDFTETVDPIVAIWDAGGVDTIDVSGWSTNQTVDLTAGAFSSVGSMTKNLAIAYGAVIENAIGGGGGDTLLGNAASNRLEGRNGNDTLRGGAGNDTLLGGRGIDTLEGGAGADIFYFAAADQGGTVLDFSAADRLRFASTSLAGTVFATASQSGADTSFALNGTSITLKNTLKSGLAVSGADILMSSGSVDMVINGTSASETLSGGSGNDSINGLGGTDRLYGGDGDDILDAGAGGSSFQYLYGQSGNDSYHYAKASGHVFINIGGETEGGGTDTVIFSDLTAAELDVGTVQYSNANGTALDLRWDDGSDSGTLRLAELGQHIEHYEFADGRRFDAILTADGSGMQHPSVTGAIVTGGTSGSDMLIGGTGRDFAFGGAGDDLLDAGARDGDEWQYLFGQDDDDTYLYAKASGRVFITTAGEDAGGGTDTVVFRDLNAADITAQTVEFSNANGTTLDLRWQDGGDNGILRLADLGQHIERFEFADRGFDTILTAEGSGAAHSGIDGVTQTFGTSGADLVLGGAGRDFAYGGAGDDLLDAGGRDGDEWQYLFGQDDDDTYLYAKASGRVFITTAGEDAGGGTDTVVFRDLDATDITAQTVAFSNANGTTLDLRWDDGGDSGILRLADLGQHIEHYVFADGTTVDADYFLL